MHDRTQLALADEVAASGPDLVRRASLEVTPRTAEKVGSFGGLLPACRCIYIANPAGVDAAEIIETAKRIDDGGLVAVPHIVARRIPDMLALDRLLGRLADEAGFPNALLLRETTTVHRENSTNRSIW